MGFSFWIPHWWFGTRCPIALCLSFPVCKTERIHLLPDPFSRHSWDREGQGLWSLLLSAGTGFSVCRHCQVNSWLAVLSLVSNSTLRAFSLQSGRNLPSDSQATGSSTHLKPNSSPFMLFFPPCLISVYSCFMCLSMSFTRGLFSCLALCLTLVKGTILNL